MIRDLSILLLSSPHTACQTYEALSSKVATLSNDSDETIIGLAWKRIKTIGEIVGLDEEDESCSAIAFLDGSPSGEVEEAVKWKSAATLVAETTAAESEASVAQLTLLALKVKSQTRIESLNSKHLARIRILDESVTVSNSRRQCWER